MEVDYSGFLQVLPDGSIWWPMGDAVKLGAGYQPMRDDHTDLVPVLQAFNNRNVAAERGLLSEFSPDRITEAHPRILERDGVRFVEAHEFLNWLWIYANSGHLGAVHFPHSLARAVSGATNQTLAGETTPFQSLTLALEAWFDKPMDELPVALQLRVRNEFSPMPWDGEDPESRRKVTLNLDYQHDPEMEKDRQHWTLFWQQQSALKRQIEDWQRTATPTAGELATKEARLDALKRELARMEVQKRRSARAYNPAHKGVDAGPLAPPSGSSSNGRYVAYPLALRQLTDRLRASAEELAAWVWSGSEDGGIDAFLNANELLPPPRFSYATRTDIDQDYVALLMGCWFLEQDITNFEPQKRYVTGAQLVERWGALPGIRAAPYIMAKIVESRLSEVHPTFGGTQGTFPDEPDWPPLESRLFDLAEVNAIELEDFGVDAAKQTSSGLAQNAQVAATTPKLSTGRGLARKLTTQAMYEAWQKAYRKLKRRHPKKSDVWHATQISKQPVSQGRNVSTIRKHMHAGKK